MAQAIASFAVDDDVNKSTLEDKYKMVKAVKALSMLSLIFFVIYMLMCMFGKDSHDMMKKR